MLMIFCLKVFYLPCLKNLVTKTEKYNEVCMWYGRYAQIYRILDGCEEIWILCSSGKNNISRVNAANE